MKKKRKKEDEQNWHLWGPISWLRWRLAEFCEYFYIGIAVLLVYRIFALLLDGLGVCAPITYVQNAILNICHPYIVVLIYM